MNGSNDVYTGRIDDDDDDDGDDDFLTQSLQMESNCNGDCPRRSKPPKSRYNSKKPKWWRQQSRKPSKRLKQAIYALQDEYCIVRPPYGERLDWKVVFSGTTTQEQVSQHKIWIEIGFGLGDNLLCLANRYPDRCFLGSEVHAGGVGSILQKVQKSLQDGLPWAEYRLFTKNNDAINQNIIQASADSSSQPDTQPELQAPVEPTSPAQKISYDNLRIYRQDITKLIPYIPDHTVHAILVTFPDPFPYGIEWRLLQVDVINELHRILVHGGQLFLATDHLGHFDWCQTQVRDFNHDSCSSTGKTTKALFDRVEPTPDRGLWLPVVSKYEQKGWDEGRETLLACWSAL